MKKGNKKNIPRFKNLEEEAQYWNKHSIAPFWDSLEEVDLELNSSHQKNNWLLIKLDNKTISKLNKLAHRKHQSLQKLAKKWVESIAS